MFSTLKSKLGGTISTMGEALKVLFRTITFCLVNLVTIGGTEAREILMELVIFYQSTQCFQNKNIDP